MVKDSTRFIAAALAYSAQALIVVRRTPVVQFFGGTTGFVVNYDPDHAIRFDLDGNPVEVLNHAYRPGEVPLTVGGKTIPAEKLFKIVGAMPTATTVLAPRRLP